MLRWLVSTKMWDEDGGDLFSLICWYMVVVFPCDWCIRGTHWFLEVSSALRNSFEFGSKTTAFIGTLFSRNGTGVSCYIFSHYCNF